jgi:hypothetical protein
MQDPKFNVKGVEKSIQKEVFATVVNMRDMFRVFSPVDSGRYQRSWRYRMTSPTSGIVKNTTQYASVVEGGVGLGDSHPWAFAGPKSPGLTMFAGRLWSKKAPGGVIDPALGIRPLRRSWGTNFADRIADAIVGSL